MGDYLEDESSYDSSQDSELDETDQAWSNEEDGCDESCSDDNYSMSEYGDDPDEAYPEPEPPDYSYEDTSHQGEYEGETEPNISFNEENEFPGDNTEGDDKETDQEDYGSDSWQEEEDTLNQEAEQENTFGDNSRREESNQSPNNDQDIEEGS
ncbi:acidic leucine-rich nuclear phosphoprotein 32-related protein 2-like [Raphanus sativus]|uniref:Acidic leucine-rich nuclear phosphoprotein 32-related protein 2-like n=1 Tax=Raphanus sativus TaxID=3726 RepID=A0A9W3C7P8_RAPSA|nr:acidic leucine-rich nuclear phosphoprotein 32-related protein 2-like [Raphanus sativus]